MGADKQENEELLQWGFPEDVWFHVDDMSSAHVYLRMPEGMSVESIPEGVLQECAQVVKANSIQGSKSPSVNVIYTAFENLKKTASMDVGQVGFKNSKKVYKMANVRKQTDILKKMEHTKEERQPDLRAMKEERDREMRRKEKKLQQEQKQQELDDLKKKKKEDELKSYKSLMVASNMVSNKSNQNVDYRTFEDDFM